MQLVNELNDKNFLVYAAKHYNNPRCLDIKEFHADLSHLKYIKKLFKKYLKDELLDPNKNPSIRMNEENEENEYPF